MTGMPRSPLTPSTTCICNYPRCAGGPPVREGGRGRGSAAAVGRPRGQAAGLERGGGGRGGRGPGVLREYTRKNIYMAQKYLHRQIEILRHVLHLFWSIDNQNMYPLSASSFSRCMKGVQ